MATIHPDLDRQNPEKPLKGSVSFKAGSFPALKNAVEGAMQTFGVTFGLAMKVVGTIGADQWKLLSHHEKGVALGIFPF